MANKKLMKTARFGGVKVTEQFLNKTVDLKKKYGISSDTKLIETAVDFLSLTDNEKFKNMRVTEFLDIYFTVKKG